MKQFANYNLDNECLASQILQGCVFSKDYQKLRASLCQMPAESICYEIDSLIQTLQKKLVDSDGYLKHEKIQKYLKGTDEEVYSLFLELLPQVDKYFDTYQYAMKAKQIDSLNELENKILSTQEYFDKVQAINQGNFAQERLLQLNRDSNYLRLMHQYVYEIIGYYGVGKSANTKPKFHHWSEDYKMFLLKLSTELPDFVDEALLAMTVAKAMDAIFSLIPKDSLDPFKQDILDNAVDLLLNPEQFYSACKNGGILAPEVVVAYNHAYPEYYLLFAQQLLEDFDSLSGPEQDSLRRSLGLLEAQGDLVTICNQALQLSYLKGDTV